MLGLLPISVSNKISAQANLSNPTYNGGGIGVSRLPGLDALPFGQKPFSIQVESPSEDFLFLPKPLLACPKQANSLSNLKNKYHTNLKSYVTKIGEFLKEAKIEIHKTFGHFQWTPARLSEVFESFQAEYYYTGKFRKGFSEMAYQKFSLLHGMYVISSNMASYETLKMHTHHISEKIRHALSNRVKQRMNNRKFVLLSGEEKSLFAMLRLFNVISYDCLAKRLNKDLSESKGCVDTPEPGSSLIIELLEKKGKYSVSVLYDGKQIEACPHLSEKHATDRRICPLANFMDYMQNAGMVDSFFELCENDEVSI